MIENAAPLRPEVRVLIVDDSVVVREILKQMLESDPGIRVVGMAANGGEAVELTARLKPDLVTMDLVMPGMGGMEATERIMAYHPTPVLFFSSFIDQEGQCSRLDALAAGALDIMAKPTLMPDQHWEAMAAPLVRKVKALAQVPVIKHIYGGRVSAIAARHRRPGPASPRRPSTWSGSALIGRSARAGRAPRHCRPPTPCPWSWCSIWPKAS